MAHRGIRQGPGPRVLQTCSRQSARDEQMAWTSKAGLIRLGKGLAPQFQSTRESCHSQGSEEGVSTW